MKVFSFNLVPEKPKELIVKEEERDISSVYTAVLPLFAVLVWIGALLFNGLLVEKTKATWQKSIDTKNARIQSEFLPAIIQNGELVVKTKALAELIVKDIKPENLFRITEEIFPTKETGVEISGYGRDADGSFKINIITDTYEKLAEVTRRFSNNKNVSGVTIKGSSLEINPADPNINRVRGAISFFINEEFIRETDVSTTPTTSGGTQN